MKSVLSCKCDVPVVTHFDVKFIVANTMQTTSEMRRRKFVTKTIRKTTTILEHFFNVSSTSLCLMSDNIEIETEVLKLHS